MLLKFITKSLRPLGLFLIFAFSVMCIFWSLFLRDLDSGTILGKIADYSVAFDNRFYDFRMKSLLDPNFVSKDIVIVNIDDYSLQNIGSWPIPRTIHAQMLRKLKHFGVKVVGMDVMFPEKSPVCGGSSPDNVFSDAISDFQSEGGKVFIGYTVQSRSDDDTFAEAPSELMDGLIDSITSSAANMRPMKVGKFTFPNASLLDSKVGLAYINSKDDTDGIFRHYQIVAYVDEVYYGSMGYNVFSHFAAKKPLLKVNKNRTGVIEVNGKELEVDSNGETKIRYFGTTKNFMHIPLYDLLKSSDNDKEIRKLVEGKMVFVGSSAMGAHDFRHSPVDPNMPGMFAHINIAEMLSHQYFYQPSDASVKYSLAILLIGLIILLVFQKFGSATMDLLGLAAMLGGTYYVDRYYFMPQGYELKLFYCFFCFIACYSWTTLMNFSEANKEKKLIKGTFARYVAPTIVDEMLKDPDKLHVGGFKTDITCLFSDVRDFTSISEGLSATELAQSLNMYMGKMTDIVFETKGTLDKYIGDAIVAFWGAPLEIGNHAQFAVEAAIKMMELLPAINEQFKILGRPEFKVGIGLNSGECNVGNMGSDRIFSYTALGDNMNLGARLESLCKHYGGDILISEYTLARIDQEKIKVRPIDKAIVKGKTTSVAIFEVLHAFHPMSINPEMYSLYLNAWRLFVKREFSQAYDICTQILITLENDKPTKRLKEICHKYVNDPSLAGVDFDITKMTEKSGE